VPGYLDDRLIVPPGMALALKMIPDGVRQEARMLAAEPSNGERKANHVPDEYV
jgi:hypothetical protein